MKQGIIRLTGTVQDVTYLQSSGINITLEYERVYEKLADEPSYQLVSQTDDKRCVTIPYDGPAQLSGDAVQKLAMPEEEENVSSYGYGATLDNIHRGNRVTVYVLYHTVEKFEHATTHVVDKVVIINHSPQQELLCDLVECVASAAHPLQ